MVNLDKCLYCGSSSQIQYHHTSYKPEIIIPLCVSCHKTQHKRGVGKSSIVSSNKNTIRLKVKIKGIKNTMGTFGIITSRGLGGFIGKDVEVCVLEKEL